MLRLMILCLVLPALPCAAQTYQFANTIYDIPAGWKQGAINDGLQYIIPEDFDGRCGKCRIMLALGQPADPGQPLTAVIEARRIAFVDEDARDDVVVIQPARALRSGTQEIALIGQLVDGDTLQIVFATRLRDRIEVMAFSGPAEDEAELTETSTVFSTDAMPLFTGARFVSEGAAPLMPPARPGDLDGVYYGLSTSWALGLDGMLKMTLNHRILVFWADGHFYDGTPPDGLRTPDVAALMAAGDTDVGTYTRRRRDIVLTYASGETETFDLRGEVLQDGDRPLLRGEPVADGTPLSGTISSFSFTALGPTIGGASSGLTNASTLVLSGDGTWVSDGWSGAAATFDNGAGYATSASDGNQGRYAVRDGLVIRTDASGTEVARALAYRLDGDIYIGTDVLEPR